MPMLLEDLAEEASASNRRVADRFDEETQHLDELRRGLTQVEQLRPQAVATAQQATDYVLSQASRAQSCWPSALAWLRSKPSQADAERFLRRLLVLFESGERLVRSSRALWQFAEALGATPAGLDELEQAAERFHRLVAEVKRALEHLAGGWQPTDPDRLAQGLQLARQGSTIKADEARAWFRKERG
jgi:HAMP domain-containing protein